MKQDKLSLLASLSIKNIEGRELSDYNQLMIRFQLGNASIVGGFKQWKKQGRAVRKGEHGALILFPVGPKDKDGEVEQAETFFTGVVFDISQTEEIQETDNAEDFRKAVTM
ncbi:MAG: ArdC family protein [Melioribacteraceae bacterium]|nr:ArdC family protein [Melioribacteraceae bacterium]